MPAKLNSKHVLFSIVTGTLAGSGIALLFPVGKMWMGMAASSLLMTIAIYVLVTAWLRAGREKTLAWMILLSFLLRLGLGIWTTLALPEYGYDEEVQQAGYLFFDAYTRDQQAWHFAESGRSLLLSFQNEFWTDQYGGLMGLSAIVYRFLSPDAHRSYLILILGCFVFSLGIPFFWKAVQFRWNRNIANLAAWILVLYPDGVLFSSSQMREPFLIGLFSIALWGAIYWRAKPRQAIAAIAISLGLMGLISLLVAAAAATALSLWLWIEEYATRIDKRGVFIGWAAFGLIFLAVITLGYDWFRNTAQWDLLLTERSSGWVSKSIEEIGGKARVPFMVGYGLVQPLLPAAVAEDAIAFWKTIGIVRSTGWYLLVPFLAAAPFLILDWEKSKDRRLFILLAALVFSWILISSIRAGGDQWDNPRYRSIFIPLMALLTSLTWFRVRESRSPWLFRMVFVEIIFLAFFTNWYFSRYFLLWRRLPFWENILWIFGLSSIVILGGLLWDFFLKKHQQQRKDTG